MNISQSNHQSGSALLWVHYYIILCGAFFGPERETIILNISNLPRLRHTIQE